MRVFLRGMQMSKSTLISLSSSFKVTGKLTEGRRPKAGLVMQLLLYYLGSSRNFSGSQFIHK